MSERWGTDRQNNRKSFEEGMREARQYLNNWRKNGWGSREAARRRAKKEIEEAAEGDRESKYYRGWLVVLKSQ